MLQPNYPIQQVDNRGSVFIELRHNDQNKKSHEKVEALDTFVLENNNKKKLYNTAINV